MTQSALQSDELLNGEPRLCLRKPVPEIALAARLLDEATTAHLASDRQRAAKLISLANLEAVREWTESLWGKRSAYNQPRPSANSAQFKSSDNRTKARMPGAEVKKALLGRDGYHCRFCGIPVIREQVRRRIVAAYPELVLWPRKNTGQHAGLQAMWAHFDHVLPHSRGGTNDCENMIVTCAPCNCARMQYTLEDFNLADPRLRPPVQSAWDGLERFR